MVRGHDVRKVGWWIFKKKVPIIHVRISPGHLQAFNNIARTQMKTVSDEYLQGIAPICDFGMTKEELNQYPTGAEVGITFGYAPVVEQYFTGANPLKVMKIEIMRPEVKLINEVTCHS